MSFNKPVHRIAIVGTGVIGASWAAQYLARGFDVIATDPAPNAEANLRKHVEEAWPALRDIGLSAGASCDRLAFDATIRIAWTAVFSSPGGFKTLPRVVTSCSRIVEGKAPSDH